MSSYSKYCVSGKQVRAKQRASLCLLVLTKTFLHHLDIPTQISQTSSSFFPQQQKQFVGNKKKLLHRAVLWDAGMQAPQPWHPWQRVQPNDPEHEHNMPKHHGIFNEMLSKTIKNLFFDKSSWVILILSDCVRTNPLALKLDKYARRMDQSRFLEVRTSRHPEARIARNA